MTRDEVESEHARRMAAVPDANAGDTPLARSLDKYNATNPPHLYAPGEFEALAAAAGEEARRRRKAGSLEDDIGFLAGLARPINYDELTEDQRRAMAGSIVGDDAEDARRIAEYDAAIAAEDAATQEPERAKETS